MASGRDRESRGYSVIFSANEPSTSRPEILEEPDDFPVFVGGEPVSSSNVSERVESDLRGASSSSSAAPIPSGPRDRNGRQPPLPQGRGRDHALSLDPNVPTDLQSLYDLYAHDPLIKFAQDLVSITGDRINSVIRDDSIQRLLQEPSPQIPIVSHAWREHGFPQDETFVDGFDSTPPPPPPPEYSSSPPPPPPLASPSPETGSTRHEDASFGRGRRQIVVEDEDDVLIDQDTDRPPSPSHVGSVESFLNRAIGSNSRVQELVRSVRSKAVAPSSTVSSSTRPGAPTTIRPTDRPTYRWLRGESDGRNRGGSTVRGGIQTHRNRTGSSSSRGRGQGGLQIRLDLIQSEVLGAMRCIRDKIGEVLEFPPEFDLMKLVRSDLLRSRFGRMCGHQIMYNTAVNPQMHGRDTEKKKIAHEASMMRDLDWIHENVAFSKRDGTFSLKKKGRRW